MTKEEMLELISVINYDIVMLKSCRQAGKTFNYYYKLVRGNLCDLKKGIKL